MTLPPRNQRFTPCKIDTRQSKNGVRFTARVVDPQEPDKGYQSIGTFGQEWEAEQAIIKTLSALESGASFRGDATASEIGSVSLSRFIDDVFLPTLDVRQTTVEDYKLSCKHIKAYFKDTPLDAVTPSEVKRFLADFRHDKTAGRERSANYRRKVAQRFRQVYNVAVADGYVSPEQHPYRASLGKTHQLPKRPALSKDTKLEEGVVEEILRILESEADTHASEEWGQEAEFWYHFLLLARWSGMRLSELMGLTFEDFVIDTPEINVDKQWAWNSQATDRRDMFRPLKTESASHRRIPMNERVFQKLYAWAAKMRERGSRELLVFPRPTSTGLAVWGSSSYFHRKYRKMIDLVYGIYEEDQKSKPYVMTYYTKKQFAQNIHEYRHLYASYCLSTLSLDVNTVSKWLGHHSPAFTYEVYSGLVKKAENAAASKMRNAPSGGQQRIL